MSLLRKTQGVPKAFWIITAIAIVIGIVAALLIPVPRLYKWSVFFIVFLVLATAGILGYSIWKKNKNSSGISSNRVSMRRRGRR